MPEWDLNDFMATGGLPAREQAAARTATVRAVAEEQRLWLPMLEAWVEATKDDLLLHVMLIAEVRRVRRALRLPAWCPSETADHRRQQTRERVRRYRQRRREQAMASQA
jgi:hypothetical protein